MDQLIAAIAAAQVVRERARGLHARGIVTALDVAKTEEALEILANIGRDDARGPEEALAIYRELIGRHAGGPT